MIAYCPTVIRSYNYSSSFHELTSSLSELVANFWIISLNLCAPLVCNELQDFSVCHWQVVQSSTSAICFPVSVISKIWGKPHWRVMTLCGLELAVSKYTVVLWWQVVCSLWCMWCHFLSMARLESPCFTDIHSLYVEQHLVASLLPSVRFSSTFIGIYITSCESAPLLLTWTLQSNYNEAKVTDWELFT
jgi:hypothetical protein